MDIVKEAELTVAKKQLREQAKELSKLRFTSRFDKLQDAITQNPMVLPMVILGTIFLVDTILKRLLWKDE